MAKLSSRGRKEIARFERERTISPETPGPVLSEKTVIAVMSDGKALQNRIAVFAATAYDAKPRRHSCGWKLMKLKADLKTADGKADVAKLETLLVSMGFTKKGTE